MSLLRDQFQQTDYRLTNDIVTEESLTSAETIESTILQVVTTCFIVDCYVQFFELNFKISNMGDDIFKSL